MIFLFLDSVWLVAKLYRLKSKTDKKQIIKNSTAKHEYIIWYDYILIAIAVITNVNEALRPNGH